MALGLAEDSVCVTLELSRPPSTGFFHGLLDIDSDLSRDTGSRTDVHDRGRCDYRTGLGLDQLGESDWAYHGILARVYDVVGDGPSPPAAAYFLVDVSTVTFVVPRSSFGAGANAGFAVEMLDSSTYDCAPNSGHITCENGTCAFVPFRNGDADCVTGANAIDAAIVLQYGAGLLPTLACPEAADVNGNAVIDSRDAALILQFSAGLLAQLPPINRCPPICTEVPEG
jgi:hypothetical protein